MENKHREVRIFYQAAVLSVLPLLLAAKISLALSVIFAFTTLFLLKVLRRFKQRKKLANRFMVASALSLTFGIAINIYPNKSTLLVILWLMLSSIVVWPIASYIDVENNA